MSDDIQCCVDGCKLDAEIEVERAGNTLWICGDHFRAFIPPTVTQLENKLATVTHSRDYFRKAAKELARRLKDAREEISSLLAEAEAKEK